MLAHTLAEPDMRFCKSVTYPVYRPSAEHTFAELDFDSHAGLFCSRQSPIGRDGCPLKPLALVYPALTGVRRVP